MESQQLRVNFLFESLAENDNSMSRLVRDYLNYLCGSRGSSVNTILSYGRDLLGFIRFCHKKRVDRIGQVKPKIVFMYLSVLRNQGKAGSSVYRAFEAIKMMVKFAVIFGKKSVYFSQLICLQAPKFDKKLPKVLSVCDVKKLLASKRTSSRRVFYRDRAILMLLYCSGVRCSEVSLIKVCDINYESHQILIHGKGSKERLLPLLLAAEDALLLYVDKLRHYQVTPLSDKSEGYFFLSKSGKQLYRHDIWRVVERNARLAGLNNVSPHTLRHSFATHLLKGGADLRVIQEALGHKSILTTQLYTHVDLVFLRKSIEKCHPLADDFPMMNLPGEVSFE